MIRDLSAILVHRAYKVYRGSKVQLDFKVLRDPSAILVHKAYKEVLAHRD